VPVAARRHGAIPNVQVQLPRRPSLEQETDPADEKTVPVDRWAFSYRGNAGEPYDSALEEQNPEKPLKPAVELPEAHPLTVLFYQDTQTVQTPTEPKSANFSLTFDDSATDPTAIGTGELRLSSTDVDQPNSTDVYLAVGEFGGFPTFLEQWESLKLRITYGGAGAAQSFILFEITDWEKLDEAGVFYVHLSVTPEASSIDVADGPIADGASLFVELLGLARPNAAVRARVRYRNGKSEATFDCDWAGGFQVLADRLELSRVLFVPDATAPFADAAVDISATVIADAPRPGGSLALTVPPVPVPDLSGKRYAEFPIHPFGRRVNLLLKYGDDPDAPGDVPLGQIFLAFVGKFGRSLCYIDAMAAREALFGAGLPIPAGCSKLVVSNTSDDDTMQIGVMWRLEL
jgi:hypothetical protein